MDWAAKRDWAEGEHERRVRTPAGEGEREDFRLAGIAGASWSTGLAAAMDGDDDAAAALLRRAADEYDAKTWKLDGTVEDLTALYTIGQELAGSEQWPNWYEGNPFKAARDAALAK